VIFKVDSKILWFLFLVFTMTNSIAQESTKSWLKKINVLIEQDSINSAQDLLKKEMNSFLKSNNYEELTDCILPYSNIALLKEPEHNLNEIISVFKFIPKKTDKPEILYKYHIEIAKFYSHQNLFKEALEYSKNAIYYADKLRNVHLQVECRYYMGEFNLYLGNFEDFFQNINIATEIIEKEGHDTKVFQSAAKVFRTKAGIMHFTSKPDSANIYFKKALDYIPKLEKNIENTYYLPSTIYSNWFLVKQAEGDYLKAQEFIFNSIRLKNKFLSLTKNKTLHTKALGNLSISYRNITSLLHNLGNYEKAKHFSELGYNLVKKHLKPNNIKYFHGILLMAETSNNYREYDKAIVFLKEAEEALTNIQGDKFQWYSQLYAIYANAYFQKRDFSKAIEFYNKYETYRLKNNDSDYSYDDIYLKLNQAQAYAELEAFKDADAITNEIHDYVEEKFGDDSFLKNECLVNELRISNTAKNYKKTLELVKKSLKIYQKTNKNRLLDKYYFEGSKSSVLLLKSQAEYHLLKDKNENNLLLIANTIDKMIELLEEKKKLISSPESINLLIEEYTDQINFAKKIYLDLYNQTQKKIYLDKILELHESAIYNKIRARLNLNEVTSSEIPKKIASREKGLKRKLNSYFKTDIKKKNDVSEIINTLEEWNTLQDSLQQFYSNYHNLKYANSKKLTYSIPKNSTVVKYIFISNKLHVILLTEDSEEMIPLSFEDQEAEISLLNDFKKDISEFSRTSNKLYNMLWKPIENRIKTKKVIIFPDQNLFNLSFELLTPNEITNYKELSEKSLLAKHQISYNYSLFLLKENRKIVYNKDFIAFVPEFDNKMKNDYRLAIKDSIDFDKTYINLLPQPFSIDLAEKFSTHYNGESFLNSKASKKLFLKKQLVKQENQATNLAKE